MKPSRRLLGPRGRGRRPGSSTCRWHAFVAGTGPGGRALANHDHAGRRTLGPVFTAPSS